MFATENHLRRIYCVMCITSGCPATRFPTRRDITVLYLDGDGDVDRHWLYVAKRSEFAQLGDWITGIDEMTWKVE